MHAEQFLFMSFSAAKSLLGGEHLYLPQMYQAFVNCFIYMFCLLGDCVFYIPFAAFYRSFAL